MSQSASAIQTRTNKPFGKGTLTPEKLDSLFEHMRSGKLLLDWCKARKMSPGVVFNFLNTEAGQPYREKFYRAREDMAHVFIEDTIKIADEIGTRTKPLDPQRQKLRVDTRMRIAGFFNRKIYGTRPEDAALAGQLTLGELVDAAIAHGKKLAHGEQQQPLLDITPAAAGEPAQPSLLAMRTLAHAVMAPPAPADTPHTEQSAARPRRRAGS